jgi:N-glycosylase/DNA lyase
MNISRMLGNFLKNGYDCLRLLINDWMLRISKIYIFLVHLVRINIERLQKKVSIINSNIITIFSNSNTCKPLVLVK